MLGLGDNASEELCLIRITGIESQTLAAIHLEHVFRQQTGKIGRLKVSVRKFN